MKEVIAWILLSISALGGLYTIGLMVYFFSLPKDANDDCCACKECEF